MGVELELIVLLALQTLGMGVFAVFEVETSAWRKVLKWAIVILVTLGLYGWVGHWALLFPATAALAGGTVHVLWCRKHGIHPLHATPRRRYYQLRRWEWKE